MNVLYHVSETRYEHVIVQLLLTHSQPRYIFCGARLFCTRCCAVIAFAMIVSNSICSRTGKEGYRLPVYSNLAPPQSTHSILRQSSGALLLPAQRGHAYCSRLHYLPLLWLLLSPTCSAITVS